MKYWTASRLVCALCIASCTGASDIQIFSCWTGAYKPVSPNNWLVFPVSPYGASLGLNPTMMLSKWSKFSCMTLHQKTRLARTRLYRTILVFLHDLSHLLFHTCLSLLMFSKLTLCVTFLGSLLYYPASHLYVTHNEILTFTTIKA